MFSIVCVQERTITISVTERRRRAEAEARPVEKIQKLYSRAWPAWRGGVMSWCAGVTGACHASVTVTMSRCVTLGPHCQHWQPPLTDIWHWPGCRSRSQARAGALTHQQPPAEDSPEPGRGSQALSVSASPSLSPAISHQSLNKASTGEWADLITDDRQEEEEQHSLLPNHTKSCPLWACEVRYSHYSCNVAWPTDWLASALHWRPFLLAAHSLSSEAPIIIWNWSPHVPGGLSPSQVFIFITTQPMH